MFDFFDQPFHVFISWWQWNVLGSSNLIKLIFSIVVDDETIIVLNKQELYIMA